MDLIDGTIFDWNYGDSEGLKGFSTDEAVFGSTLAQISSQEGGALVPRFIRVVTELIEARGLDTDGIYRVSGNLSSIQKIRCSVDQGMIVEILVRDRQGTKLYAETNNCMHLLNLKIIIISNSSFIHHYKLNIILYASNVPTADKYALVVNEEDVHVLSGSLKLFFRELAESAFPPSSTKAFLQAVSKYRDKGERGRNERPFQN